VLKTKDTKQGFFFLKGVKKKNKDFFF